jgi:metal-dependent amidase/aminoacylase/carboxypeptidase family protein
MRPYHCHHGSLNDGMAHKCGHDGHMAIVIGLAHRLREHPPERGKIYLLFQPAEETGEGAEMMLEDHKLSDIEAGLCLCHPQFARLSPPFCAASPGCVRRRFGGACHTPGREYGARRSSGAGPQSRPAVASLIPALEELPGKVLQAGRFGVATVIHVRIGDPAFGTTPGKATVMATLRATGAGGPGEAARTKR